MIVYSLDTWDFGHFKKKSSLVIASVSEAT